MEISKISRPFPCNICNLAFKSKQFLQRHLVSHSDVRNYSCSFCGKTYKYKKGLNRHIKKYHHVGDLDLNVQLKKHFKVEDFLDLAQEEKYNPKKIWDSSKGKEVEVLFTWKLKESTFN